MGEAQVRENVRATRPGCDVGAGIVGLSASAASVSAGLRASALVNRVELVLRDRVRVAAVRLYRRIDSIRSKRPSVRMPRRPPPLRARMRLGRGSGNAGLGCARDAIGTIFSHLVCPGADDRDEAMAADSLEHTRRLSDRRRTRSVRAFLRATARQASERTPITGEGWRTGRRRSPCADLSAAA